MKFQARKLLLDILGCALGTAQLKGPVNLSARKWRSLYECACAQSVGALVYESLSHIKNNMTGEVKDAWCATYEFAIARFDAQLMSLNHLSAVLKEDGVSVQVLKGLGLALNYPKPELRECVDVDIFSGEQFDKANETLFSRGLCSKRGELEDKHATFEVDGIEVENHLRFTSQCNEANIKVGDILLELSAKAPMQDPRVPDINLPNVQMGMLHLMMHTLSHLAWSGIKLRHLCDITTYIRANKDSIDFPFIFSTLKDAGLLDSALSLIGICNDYLSMDFDASSWGAPDKVMEEEILYGIFHPFKPSSEVSDPLRKIIRKIRTHAFRCRMHRIVYGKAFPDSLMKSLGLSKS